MNGAAMESLLQQLPNGGAVVAIIVVVHFFLKHIQSIADMFAKEVVQARKDYLQSIEKIVEQKTKPRM
jgi:hypothetical protein